MSPDAEKPHWQGHRERLRTELLKRGAGAPDDYEILEVLLMALTPRRDVKPIAKALQAKFGSLSASGDPKPSRADIDITREIIDALDPFGITVHDHLVVGTSGVVSLRSAGLI